MKLTGLFDGRDNGVLLCVIAFLIAVPVCIVSAAVPSVYSAWGTALDANSYWVIEGQVIIDGGATEMFPNSDPYPSLTPEEIARGYVPYIRHYMDGIYKASRPYRSEIRSDAMIFASPGEYEPISLSIFSLHDINGVTAEVTDLVSPDGSVISAENIDIRVVRRLICTNNGSTTEYFYRPLALEKKTTAGADMNDTLQYWLTVYIPSDANTTVSMPYGSNTVPTSWTDAAISNTAYDANFTVHIPGKEDAVFTLKVAVLPIDLSEPNRSYGLCYLPNPPSRGTFPENMPKQMIDMHEHGMNSMWNWSGMDAEADPVTLVEYDFNSLGPVFDPNYHYCSVGEVVQAYMNAGFTGFWVNGAVGGVCGAVDPLGLGYPCVGGAGGTYDTCLLQYIEQIRDHATTNGWPDFCHHYLDEPHFEPWLSYEVDFANMVKAAYPDEMIFIDYGPWAGEDAVLIPSHDICCLAIPTVENVAAVVAGGKEPWMYNVGGWGHYPETDRLTWGLMARKIGVKGVYMWVYQWWWGPSSSMGHPTRAQYTQPSPDGPIPSPAWQAVRESIDDERYAQTLTELVEQIGLQDPNAAAAQTTLDNILAPMSYEGRHNYMSSHSSISYDENRWQLARHILNMLAVDDTNVLEQCGDWGYLVGDLDENCYVDFLDWCLLAELYLAPSGPNEVIYNYQGVTTATNDLFAYACDVDYFPFGGNASNLNSKVEATDLEYGYIDSTFGGRWITADPDSGDEIFLWLDMEIEEDISDIEQIDLTFIGYTEASSTKHKIYVLKTGADWTQNSSWVAVGSSLVIPSGSDMELTVAITSNFSDYIDPVTGAITWGVYQFDTSSQPLRTNYVQMKITGDLIGDLDGDNNVFLSDVADFVEDWLKCTDPNDPANCEVAP